MRAGLSTASSCWFLLRLCNLSTLIREWTALHAFPSLAFKDVLLSAKPPVKDGKQGLFIPQVECTESLMRYPLYQALLSTFEKGRHQQMCGDLLIC